MAAFPDENTRLSGKSPAGQDDKQGHSWLAFPRQPSNKQSRLFTHVCGLGLMYDREGQRVNIGASPAVELA